MRTVSLHQSYDLLDLYVKSGLVPYLKSSPGVGKSSIVKKWAADNNLLLIDVRLSQCDPTDLNGFPAIDKTKEKAYYVPMSTFPLEGDPIPEGYRGWALFFDEVNGADRSTQKASYKVFLDKEIGTQKIHGMCAMLCAGNLETDNALVEELSSALQSRLVHIQIHTDPFGWLEHARERSYSPEVISFIEWLPASLNTFNPDKQGDEPTYPCERTWEMVSKLLTKNKNRKSLKPSDPLALEALCGVIGEGKAIEFLGYLRMFEDLPTIKQIVAEPNSTQLPTAPGTCYALTGVIAQAATKSNIAQLMKYVERLIKEYQVVTVRNLMANDAELLHTPSVNTWMADNAQLLFPA